MNAKRAAQRASLIAERRAICAPRRKQWDSEIAAQVLAWCKDHAVNSIGVYNPIQGEPSLYEIYPSLKQLGVQLALPCVPTTNQALTFLAWSPGDPLMKDRHGVLVPLETAPVAKPEVLLIPCVGYTAEKFRLGYGGGYYDRTLAANPRPTTIGIAYRISQCDLEVQPHDIAMDHIITNL